MFNMFLVAIGGAVGSLGRFGLANLSRHLWPAAEWPAGTFIANIVGGVAMGLLMGALLGPWKGMSWGMFDMERTRLLLGVGVLGGITTFSTFSLETVFMLERRQYALALGYAALSVVLAVAGVALGLFIMRKVAA